MSEKYLTFYILPFYIDYFYFNLIMSSTKNVLLLKQNIGHNKESVQFKFFIFLCLMSMQKFRSDLDFYTDPITGVKGYFYYRF